MKKILILVVSLFSLSFSQSEFLINTYLDSTQRDPQIAIDAQGNYVVVWQSFNQVSSISEGDIYLQRYNALDQKIGTETLVNTITNKNQERPALAMNSAGNFVIVWTSFNNEESIYDIKGRLYKNNIPTGDEFLVNTTTMHSQTNPSVGINENGDFVIVWESWYQDGGDKGIYAQRFDANGQKTGNEFLVNTTTAYSQARPAVKYMPNGNFIVVWESWKQDIATPSGYGLFGKIFSSAGAVVKDEFQINTYTNDYQWFGDLDVFGDNSFVVVWCSWKQDGSDGGIYFQRFDSNGNKTGNETLANHTTSKYQWLPRVKKTDGKKIAIVWSSWLQDGSREGVYAALFDENNKRYTFETQVNSYTDSYQWEPDFVVKSPEELLVVWASWGQYNKDYEIIGRKIKPEISQGVINPVTYNHPQGITTAKIFVHVLDSSAVNGHTYKVEFDTTGSADTVLTTITDQTTSTVKINNFRIDKGLNVFYKTETFDGIAVEFRPVFKLEFDDVSSYFVNNSGTNLIFSYALPSAGQRLLAPVDVALIWGSTDTLANGSYSAPLDTAIGMNGQKTIVCPFYAWNITDNAKVNMLIKEPTATKNNKWDAGEEIIFLTPPPYNLTSFNSHAQVASSLPSGQIILPGIGDTNFVLTKRPIKPEDEFTFVTNKSLIISDVKDRFLPQTFSLYQNYPNPFNPYTTIQFSLPKAGRVVLNVFNILGEKVTLLMDEVRDAGTHKVLFDGRVFASGVYIYTIQFENRILTRKMMMLK
ncbi:MAG TPA: T9SS type A sorting domain-containing protein [Ignavibacteriaceae bacterium]|nr:T9SS type A sorting domain-containing protein [Ignavibacteriaceae bacterium]